MGRRLQTAEQIANRRDVVAKSVRGHQSRLNAVDIPSVQHPRRRSRCRSKLRDFMLTYGRPSFPLPFSPDHETAIQKLQQAVLTGGKFALAMPRGSGKSTMVEWTVIWAACYGHRRYIVIVAADRAAAKELLDSIKLRLEEAPRLLEDFPGLCAPVHALEKVAQRAPRLHVDGVNLSLTWHAEEIVCPTWDNEPYSGVRIHCYGLDARIRGARHTQPDGRVERPDFAIIDDPQRDKDAKSPTQIDKREDLLVQAVGNMAGPGKSVAMAMCCTVIQPDDLADRILSDKHPDIQSLRTALVNQWPDEHDGMWQHYRQLRRECLLAGDTYAAGATDYYREHQAAMDRGASVAWPERKKEHELSALQHAENLLQDNGDAAFAAEYQNQPESQFTALYELTERDIISSVNHLDLRIIPQRAPIVVGFVDLNRYGLHWMVAAARMDRALYILDYGKYPSGSAVLYKGDGSDEGTEGQVFRRGLDTLAEAIITGRSYVLEDGKRRRFDVLLVDCGYLDTVAFDFAANCRQPVMVMPSRGYGNTQYRPTAKHGRVGDGWHETEFAGKGRVLAHNADVWRMRSQKAWLEPIGAPGSVSLFGSKPAMHAELAEQAAREKLLGIEQTGIHDRYRWKAETTGQWHDLGDCVTGIHVAASYQGADPVTGTGLRVSTRRRRPRRTAEVVPT